MPKMPALRAKTVVCLFYEDSTRTRLSFETAAKRLSADTMTFSVSTSSVNKGESLLDTVQTIEAMGVDAIVVRHGCSGAPHQVAQWSNAAVINAGDGCHEHPTQALLDVFTLHRRYRGPSLDGCRVAIVGDIRHSRVARSNVKLMHATRLRGHARRPAHAACPNRLDGWPVVAHASRSRRRAAPKSTSCTCCASSASAFSRARCSRRCASTRHAGASPTSARRGCKPDTRRDAPRPDEPRHRDRRRGRRFVPLARDRTGRERRCGADGGPLVAARHREVALSERQLLVRGGRVIDATTGERNRRRAGRRRRDRRGRARRSRRRRARSCSTPRAASSRPGSSTSRCTSASRDAKTPRRSRPGSRAAALGGCTAVVCMPNTDPPLDDAAVVQSMLDRWPCGRPRDVRARRLHHQGPRGAKSSRRWGSCYDLGVRVFTDDGDCVADARVMRRAFEYRGALPGAVLAQHAEDPALVRGGHMHEGAWSARLGIPGRPADGGVDDRGARPGARRAHRRPLPRAALSHRGQSAVLVRAAKADGVRVTAECTPQHFVLTDDVCRGLRPGVQDEPAPARARPTSTRCAPRSLDGTIDAIATDHAPHSPETQGRAVRGGAAGDARRRDGARGRAHHVVARAPHAAGAPRRVVVAAGGVVGLDATVTAAPIAPGGPRTFA